MGEVDFRDEDEGGVEDWGPGQGLGPALLLGLAALLTAALFGRAALLSGDASDQWQQALRQELKRSAAVVEDVRYVYGDEAPLAYDGATLEILAQEYRSAAKDVSPAARSLLLVEARTNEELLKVVTGGSEILKDERYRLEGGGYDLGKRLADVRQENADLITINPDDPQALGDALSEQATNTISLGALAPVAFLLGSLGQVFRRRRSLLLWTGWVVLGMTLVAAVAIEVTS